MGGVQQLCIDWQKKGDLCLLSGGNGAAQEGLMKWPEALRRLILALRQTSQAVVVWLGKWLEKCEQQPGAMWLWGTSCCLCLLTKFNVATVQYFVQDH